MPLVQEKASAEKLGGTHSLKIALPIREYHDLLFLSSPNIDETELLRSAGELKLDLAKFNRDRQSAEIESRIRLDLEDAKKLNIDGAPAININGVMIKGAASFNQLTQIVQRLINAYPK